MKINDTLDPRLTDFDWDAKQAAPVLKLADPHVHYRNDKEQLETLLKVSIEYNVEYLFINCPLDNFEAVTVFEKYEKIGKRIIPYFMIDMTGNNPEIIDKAYDAGFWGIKCISPSHPYDDMFYDPVFKRAEDKGMPLLFHTGLLSKGKLTYKAGCGMSLMRGDMLDTLATRYPDLLIQGAHLGCPNIMEAIQTCIYSPNLIWDVSGGCRHIIDKEPNLFSAAVNKRDELWNNIMWATDTSTGYFAPEYSDGWPSHYEYQLAYWQKIMSKTDPVPDTEQLDKFFCKNAQSWVKRIKEKRK